MTKVTTALLNNCLTLFYLKIRLYVPVKYMQLERIKTYLVFSNLICTGFGSTVHFSLSILKISFSCNQTRHQTRSYIFSIKHHLHNYTRYFNNLLINHCQWIQFFPCSFLHVASIDITMVCQHNLYSTVADISAPTEMLNNCYFRTGEVRHAN